MTHIDKLQYMILQAKKQGVTLKEEEPLPFDLWYEMHKYNLIVDKVTARTSYNRLLKISNS